MARRCVGFLSLMFLLAVAGVDAADPAIVSVCVPDGERPMSMSALGKGMALVTLSTRPYPSGQTERYLRYSPAAAPNVSELLHAVFLPMSPVGRLFGVIDGLLYFNDTSRALWRTDGTVEGTSRVSEAQPDARPPVACGGWVYYGGTPWPGQTGGWTLYRTNGALSGSEAVASTDDPADSYRLGCLSGRLVLMGSTSQEHRFPDELMAELDAIQFPGRYGGDSVFGDDLGYFTLDGTLYRTDGTAEGTVALVEPPVILTDGLAMLGDSVFYGVSPAPDWTKSLMVSDGMPGDARQIDYLGCTCPNGWVYGFDPVGVANGLLFYQDGGIFRTDGSLDGTFRLVSLQGYVGRLNPGEYVIKFEAVGQEAYFTVGPRIAEGLPGRLMRTDGTVAGTTVLAESIPSTTAMAMVDGTIFVAGSAGDCAPEVEPPAVCDLRCRVGALTCDGTTSALRPRQARKLAGLAARVVASDGQAARRASRRVLRMVGRLQRWVGARRTVGRLGAQCAKDVGTTLQRIRDEIRAAAG